MLTKKLKIQNSERTSEPHLKKVTVASKNKMGNEFIQNFGSNFFGRYSNYSYEGIRTILSSICLVESLGSDIINYPLGYIEETNNIVSIEQKGFNLNTNDMDIDELIFKLIEISEIICVLHEHRIVHGNISLSSFKMFDKIKLAEYSKCFLLLEGKSKKLTYEAYKEEFRPLESFEKECGFYTDIWALGCVFCILIHGSSLFQFQINREQYIEKLQSWSECCFSSKDLFESVDIPISWNCLEKYKLNTLILKMMNPDKNKRPSIFEVLTILRKLNSSSSPSSSPEDVISIHSCSFFVKDYKNCIYNNKSILGSSRTHILERMKNESNMKTNLVMSIYENMASRHEFSSQTLNLCIQIANFITNQSKESDHLEELDNLDQNDLLSILNRYNKGNEIFNINHFFD